MCDILNVVNVWLGDNGVYGWPTVGSIILDIINTIAFGHPVPTLND